MLSCRNLSNLEPSSEEIFPFKRVVTHTDRSAALRGLNSNVAAAALLRMAAEILEGSSVVSIQMEFPRSIGSFRASWAGAVSLWASFKMMTRRCPVNGQLAEISEISRAASTPLSVEAFISCKPASSAPASLAIIKASVVFPHPGGPISRNTLGQLSFSAKDLMAFLADSFPIIASRDSGLKVRAKFDISPLVEPLRLFCGYFLGTPGCIRFGSASRIRTLVFRSAVCGVA